MIAINEFVSQFSSLFPGSENLAPWVVIAGLEETIIAMIAEADGNFHVENGIAIHKTAVIEQNVVLKPPMIISEHCFIGANAYLRGGVFLGPNVKIGPGCELKQSIICAGSAAAHFNFIGNSIIGRHVNLEAGAVIANHYNERENKTIFVMHQDQLTDTGTDKFGALIGDESRIGANAVLSPGTILAPRSIVKRLELINQQNK